MLRTALLAALLFTLPAPVASQERGTLRITVTLVDGQGVVTPVPRHALLISDNPPSAAPRRVVTANDGTALVMLRPGNYTVESDRPVAFQGRSFEWRQTLDIAAGREVALALTTGNTLAPEETVADLAAPPTVAGPVASDPSFLLTRWQDSVVTLWTPTMRAAGFVADANGLVVTSHRVLDGATQVEVQLTPTIKVGARVLAADPERDVVVLWIDREVVAAVRPVSLGCERTPLPVVKNEQEVFTIGAPFRGQKDLTAGTVVSVGPQAVAADFEFDAGAPGGPVFDAGGGVVGMTSMAEDVNGRRDDTPVVPVHLVCDVVATAVTKMQGGAVPDRTRLPVEPARPFPIDALRDAAGRRVGNTKPYRLSSSEFDVALITPVLIYTAQNPPMPATGPGRGNATRTPPEPPAPDPSLTNFGGWSEYVDAFPPVLLIRVTPKLVEGFWAKVGRAAASTQGVALPPIQRLTSGFSRLRAFCGATEVTPIHRFMLRQEAAAGDAIIEGLYVFDPSALGPGCGTVKLELYSQKAPAKADTRVVDELILEQIWQDFAAYRSEVP